MTLPLMNPTMQLIDNNIHFIGGAGEIKHTICNLIGNNVREHWSQPAINSIQNTFYIQSLKKIIACGYNVIDIFSFTNDKWDYCLFDTPADYTACK